jgi:hypothetical protein
MSRPAITRALVEQIVARPKFVFREKANNTQPSTLERRRSDYVRPNELRIYYEIRFTDEKEKECGLSVFARLEKPLTGVSASQAGYFAASQRPTH